MDKKKLKKWQKVLNQHQTQGKYPSVRKERVKHTKVIISTTSPKEITEDKVVNFY